MILRHPGFELLLAQVSDGGVQDKLWARLQGLLAVVAHTLRWLWHPALCLWRQETLCELAHLWNTPGQDRTGDLQRVGLAP